MTTNGKLGRFAINEIERDVRTARPEREREELAQADRCFQHSVALRIELSSILHTEAFARARNKMKSRIVVGHSKNSAPSRRCRSGFPFLSDGEIWHAKVYNGEPELSRTQPGHV